MMLICKIQHILPSEYQEFKSSWMLLSDDKQTADELITQLCSFERDIKSSDVGRTNQEALVLKSEKPQPQKAKSHTRKVPRFRFRLKILYMYICIYVHCEP